jgi:hypothetical protein
VRRFLTHPLSLSPFPFPPNCVYGCSRAVAKRNSSVVRVAVGAFAEIPVYAREKRWWDFSR